MVCSSTDLSDIKKAIELLAKFDKEIPLILQPNYFELNNTLMDKIQAFQRFALESLSDVRVIPQIHKLAGVK